MTSTIPPGGRNIPGRVAFPIEEVSSTLGASSSPDDDRAPAEHEARAAVPSLETRRLGSEALFLLAAPAAAARPPDDETLASLLRVATGAAFDRALSSLQARPRAEATELAQGAIARLAGQLQPVKIEWRTAFDTARYIAQLSQRLDNYLTRLRILRLLEVLGDAHTGELVYPFSGYDVLPSLVYPKVTGIDWKVGYEQAPVDPRTYREQRLLRDPDADKLGEAVAPLEQKLAALYDTVASEPLRFKALAAEVFDGGTALGIRASQRGHRTLFLKGLGWMHWPQKFLDDLLSTRRSRKDVAGEEDDRGFFALWNIEEAPEAFPLLTWLADHYAQPGDLVALWGEHPKLGEHLAATGRYAPWDLDFLEPELRQRLQGDEEGGSTIVVDPIENAALHRGALSLFLPSSLQLLRKIG